MSERLCSCTKTSRTATRTSGNSLRTIFNSRLASPVRTNPVRVHAPMPAPSRTSATRTSSPLIRPSVDRASSPTRFGSGVAPSPMRVSPIREIRPVRVSSPTRLHHQESSTGYPPRLYDRSGDMSRRPSYSENSRRSSMDSLGESSPRSHRHEPPMRSRPGYDSGVHHHHEGSPRSSYEGSRRGESGVSHYPRGEWTPRPVRASSNTEVSPVRINSGRVIRTNGPAPVRVGPVTASRAGSPIRRTASPTRASSPARIVPTKASSPVRLRSASPRRLVSPVPVVRATRRT